MIDTVREREQFLRLITSLSDTYRPEGVLTWLHAPNPLFLWDTPMERVLDGDWQPLFHEADRLADGPRG